MQVAQVSTPVGVAVPAVPDGTAGAGKRFENVLRELDRGERFLDRIIRGARSGRDFSPGELLAIQAGVYRHTQAVEAFSKLVDSTAGCVRRTLEATG
jgi:hypothetical protein